MTPRKYDPSLDKFRLPPRLEKAAYEIALLMEMNGFTDWCYGPIASREYCQRLEQKINSSNETPKTEPQ